MLIPLATALFLLAPLLSSSVIARIPTLSTETLSGRHIDLPKDIVQPAAILILGFTQKASQQTERWSTEVNRMSSCDAGQPVEWYELPVLSDVPRLIRPLVIRAMRSELTPEIREHFAPIILASAAWKSSVNFAQPDDAYLVVAAKDGAIRFTLHGAFDQAKQAALTANFQQACHLAG